MTTPTYNLVELRKQISIYQRIKKLHPDLHIQYCKSQSSLKLAIEVAAKAIDISGKIHSHQKLPGRKDLNNFSANLLTKITQIRCAKNFDDVYCVVKSAKTKDIGELTIYDTAIRIGNKIDIAPDKVYLHSGTRIGARKLLGRLKNSKILLVSDFPPPISSFSASEIEDMLCIRKDYWAGCIKSYV